MPGLEKILKGILKYDKTIKQSMVENFKKISDNQSKPQAVVFSCMDSRVMISRFLNSEVGDNFIIRNAGNIVPHSDFLSDSSISTEAGALELGCLVNKIRQVLVCGHSDCKAMELLYSVRHDDNEQISSPLTMWVKRHGGATIRKYEKYVKQGSDKPLLFQAETPDKKFEAFIDPDNQLKDVDKLSQINTLQQLQNIASYSMLKSQLQQDDVHLNALWFDLYSGSFYMFSRERKTFVEISEKSYDHLIKDGQCKLWFT